MVNHAQEVNAFLKSYLETRGPEIQKYSSELLASMEYSLNNGGKRFRPSLCLQAASVLKVDHKKALPFAAALEMVHTYSLIHDDLPCMDDDDERRGQPTNHIRYGEPLALLAGDGLLTEAFVVISQHYVGAGAQGLDLVSALARAAGSSGMVGGQAMDMGLGTPMDSIENLLFAHKGKTAALIAAAVEGAGILSGMKSHEARTLRAFGEKLGLAFQIKDDLLDNETTPNSVLHYWDTVETEKYLLQLHQEAAGLLCELPADCKKLMEFFVYNQERSL
ncbi:MAG: polyprenyl synthetase family protein [Bdellovibrionaceae bacterium]|nr:polyprenyl synthetase family protein [Pseudobdellovibrionaceae bacterium]